MTCVSSLYDFNDLPKLLWFFGGALSVELIRQIFRLWKLKSTKTIHEVYLLNYNTFIHVFGSFAMITFDTYKFDPVNTKFKLTLLGSV